MLDTIYRSRKLSTGCLKNFFQCEFCKATFSKSSNLSRHRKNRAIRGKCPGTIEKKIITCPHCQQVFKHLKSLKRHLIQTELTGKCNKHIWYKNKKTLTLKQKILSNIIVMFFIRAFQIIFPK